MDIIEKKYSGAWGGITWIKLLSIILLVINFKWKDFFLMKENVLVSKRLNSYLYQLIQKSSNVSHETGISEM